MAKGDATKVAEASDGGQPAAEPSHGRTAAGEALTELVLPVFELNSEFLAAAEAITRPVGLTPAWWQVLAAAATEPLAVAEIARRVGLGLARQSVQRVADLLVEHGWAVYLPNPAHRRAKLLEPTPRGRRILSELGAAQRRWADAVGADVGVDELRRALAVLRRAAESSRRHRQV